MTETILVTGASGYVGKHTVQAALEAGYRVVGTYRSRPIAIEGAEIVPLELSAAGQTHDLLLRVRPRAVIHTAASWKDSADMQRSIVLASENIARSAARTGARLIHVSTDVIFDGKRGKYTEADAPTPITEYGKAKAAAERLVQSLHPNHVIVRTSLVIGRQPLDTHSTAVRDHILSHKPMHLFTDEYRNPVWVSDLAAALVELVTTPYCGVLNVAGTQVLNRYELGVRAAQWLGLAADDLLPALSVESGLIRPLDCTLDLTLAKRLLKTKLRSMDEA